MSSDIREQALLNEYKGNLYEYLVGAALSSLYKTESKYILGLTADFRKMLAVQESFIREYYPDLLLDLPVLAKSLAQEIYNKLDLKNESEVLVELVGKVALASHDDRYAEADLVIKESSNIYPISIKLSKAHAYVNTKSAGVKSFIAKYFNSKIICPTQTQNDLNIKTEKLIEWLGRELHEAKDLDYSENYENWLIAGMPTLPGQLEGETRDIYKTFLHRLNQEIFTAIKTLFDTDKKDFIESSLSLIGFSDKNIIQATTYYVNQNGRYVLFKNIIDTFEDFKSDLSKIKLGELKTSAANFDIHFKDRILQLRLKAMNKFTSKSYKINCSVKII